MVPDSPERTRIILTGARNALLGLGALLTLTPVATPALALAGGMLLALTVGNPWPSLTQIIGSRLLQVAVVGLGFGIPLDALVRAGSTGVLSTALLIGMVLVLGVLLGR